MDHSFGVYCDEFGHADDPTKKFMGVAGLPRSVRTGVNLEPTMEMGHQKGIVSCRMPGASSLRGMDYSKDRRGSKGSRGYSTGKGNANLQRRKTVHENSTNFTFV